MQSVTIEKGQHLTLNVREVEAVPSKNPAWDSRWKIGGIALNGAEVSTYLGNKAVMQQLGRKNMQSPDDMLGGDWTFERTIEGYLNILPASGKTKTEHLPLDGAAPVVAKAPAKPMPFDEPTEDEAEAVSAKVEQMRLDKRQRVGDDIAWAVGMADSFVSQIAKNHEIEYGPDLVRSVVALAATIHISYKDVR